MTKQHHLFPHSQENTYMKPQFIKQMLIYFDNKPNESLSLRILPQQQFIDYFIIIFIHNNNKLPIDSSAMEITILQLPPIKTIQQIMLESSKRSETISQQLEGKLKTYSNFNYRQAYKEARVKRARRSQKKSQQSGNLISQLLQKAFLSSFILNVKEKGNGKKKGLDYGEEAMGLKTERRERLKKTSNTLFIIKHYVQKQSFKPTQQEMYLLKALCQIKDVSEQYSLEAILKKIYKLMNEVVDLDQIRLLCLIIMLVADLCYHHKDYSRSFFFYSQAKMYSSFTEMYQIKTEALINMALIALDLKLHDESLVFLKKALQYAWKIRNSENQLYIYDYIGNIYYYKGQLNESQYYHKRFTQGQVQKAESAIKKLSIQMLGQTSLHLNKIQKKHLNTLFLEYIKLPIVSVEVIPSTSALFNKVYENYGENGEEPRRKRKNEEFQIFKQLPPVHDQIAKLFKQDAEFISQIPNPDFQQNFIPTSKYGRSNKTIEFQQTPQFHKFMKKHLPKSHSKTIEVNSFQKRIEKALSATQNKQWWQKIRQKISKSKGLNVGQLRNRIFNSHESYAKYPQEKKRSISLKSEKINQSFNRTLLNWIDPIK